ncbi:MAG TPA: transcription-repair coupling factor [Phycisphaerae bacterium]|nr:transcription-repair coupling factor [Phycisphaerae bacterium]HNU44899.1 transcription-repair coupling factor [Phycisphaerae bacterium]
MVVALATLPQRTCLYVTAQLEEADEVQDDLELFLGRPCALFPAWEALPGEGAAAGEVEAERLRVCTLLRHAGSGDQADVPPIVAPIQALLQPVPAPGELARHILHLTAGAPLTLPPGSPANPEAALPPAGPDALLNWAIDHGFARLDLVESPGDVARRGDIVDLFAPGESHPFRLEFLEDRLESIRRFDLSTQRSIERLRHVAVTVAPRTSAANVSEQADLFAYLPADALVVLDGPAEIQEMGQTIRRRVSAPQRLFAVTDLFSRALRFGQVHLSRFGPGAAARTEDAVHFDVGSVTRFEGKADEAVGQLCTAAREHQVYVVCDNEGERRRLAEMIAQTDATAAASIHLTAGVMHHGFEWSAAGTIVVPHHEVFHRYRPIRRIRRTYASRPIETWEDLKPGDLVVHVVHGIARYRGLTRMRKGTSQSQEEYLGLEFADDAHVHVPTSQVDLVQKYVGAGGIKPTLSKLGGKRWSRTKQQVAEALTDLAAELLRTQARRAEAEGIAYPPDTEWQREFEAAFPYEETEDQLTVAADVKQDLGRPRPMDRLLCGDVGYGKTELAMRAAFKVVEYGRQVAVLVPTTVLAEQHYETFLDRMGPYPFRIGCLSRFRSAGEQKRIVSEAKKGQIDVVIGTHRLLSEDVGFANLGLVIIDEEQRFGVEHKEKLKALRATVEVLTLTATPIPRTLHMAMIGLRDISALQTPPVDRRSIATQVCVFNRQHIREAALREMNRGGQVYFLHNYVRSIHGVAEALQTIVPEARILVGHGQMKGATLDNVMHRFVRHEADILVCTTIIESGIDIPNVNTIFINRADRFGLADLHQLRGRVGRSRHRAYCYLLLSPDRPPTSKAARRLKAIEEFSELGAGFRLAMRDLEIRGAGNLLGREQSGHIAAVGYDLYCRLLDATVRRLKNEPEAALPQVQVDLDVAAYIPRNYMGLERARLEVYRRLATCRTLADVEQLERDVSDAFGPLPPPLQRLLELGQLRVEARAYGIRSISLQPPDVIFTVEGIAQAEPLFRQASGSVRMADGKTVHLRLPPGYLETGTLLAVLRQMFRRADGRVETCAR